MIRIRRTKRIEDSRVVRLSVYRGLMLADRDAGGPLDLVLELLGSSQTLILVKHLLAKGLFLKR